MGLVLSSKWASEEARTSVIGEGGVYAGFQSAFVTLF